MRIWIKVTDDKYEFPVQMADTGSELARKCGVSVNTVLSAVNRDRKGLYHSRYKCVEVEDD